MSTFCKYIMVTGGAGFMGSHMVIYLVNKYPTYFIVNVDKLCYNSSLKNLESIENKSNYKFIKADICNEKEMKKIMIDFKINHIIHFAALSCVDHSFVSALDFNHTNIYGTHVLAKLASELSIKRFLLMSTDEVYGGNSDEPSNETDQLKPTNPYACSKASAELMAQSYMHCYNLPLITIRTTNAYGPHKYPETVIPKFICLLLRGEKCCVHGKGENIRHYMYVIDAIKAYDVLLHGGVDGEVYNVGCDDQLSVLQLTRYLVRKIKGDGVDVDTFITYTPDRPFNDLHYVMTSDKIKAFGWKPEVSWEEGIDLTIEWYKKYSTNWTNTAAVLSAFPHASLTSPQPIFSHYLDSV